jgi:hypothetical protein
MRTTSRQIDMVCRNAVEKCSSSIPAGVDQRGIFFFKSMLAFPAVGSAPPATDATTALLRRSMNVAAARPAWRERQPDLPPELRKSPVQRREERC